MSGGSEPTGFYDRKLSLGYLPVSFCLSNASPTTSIGLSSGSFIEGSLLTGAISWSTGILLISRASDKDFDCVIDLGVDVANSDADDDVSTGGGLYVLLLGPARTGGAIWMAPTGFDWDTADVVNRGVVCCFLDRTDLA